MNNIKKDLLIESLSGSTDNLKPIKDIITYNRDELDVSCLNAQDIKINVPIPRTNNVAVKCLKYVKALIPQEDCPDNTTCTTMGEPNECPIGTIQLNNQNICVGNVYESICDFGYEKIDNKCYKKCNDDFITVNLENTINFTQADDGNNCIINTLSNVYYTPAMKAIYSGVSYK